MHNPKEPCEIQDENLPPTGLELIIAERERQITQEGWDARHDAKHLKAELSQAVPGMRCCEELSVSFACGCYSLYPSINASEVEP